MEKPNSNSKDNDARNTSSLQMHQYVSITISKARTHNSASFQHLPTTSFTDCVRLKARNTFSTVEHSGQTQATNHDV